MNSPYLSNFCRVTLSLICLFPAFAVIARHRPLDTDQALVIACTSICSIVLLTSLYKWLPRVTSIVMGLLALLAIGELFFVLEYLWPADANTLSVLLETNPAEATDYLHSLPRWLPVCFLFPILLTIGAFSRQPSGFSAPRCRRWLITGSMLVWLGIIAIATLFVPRDPSVNWAHTPFPVQKPIKHWPCAPPSRQGCRG